MITLSIIFAALLFAVGGIAAFVCWVVLLVRGFRESLLWGIGILLLPPVALLFMLVYWDENKRVFAASLGATALVAIAWLVAVPGAMGMLHGGRTGGPTARTHHVIGFPTPRPNAPREAAGSNAAPSASTSVAAATAVPAVSAAPAVAPASGGTSSAPGAGTVSSAPNATPTPTPPDLAVSEIEKAIAQKRIELKELYDALDVWARRLVAKRRQLDHGNPADARAFNEEYAGYEAALRDYKNQSSQVELMEVDRLEAVKRAKKKADASAVTEAK